MKPKVWTEVDLFPAALERLQAEADVITHGTWETLPGAEMAIIGRSEVADPFIDRAGPQLKLVIRHGIGYNTLDVPACTARGVLAANTPDAPTESTAEHAVALLLALAKRVVDADRLMRNHIPHRRSDLLGIEVRDQTLGVVGYGRIGRRVAEICALGLKMPVIVYDPFLTATATLPEGVRMAGSLDEVLAQSTFVTLHTPLNKNTYHLIGERELHVMPHGSYLINVSRGPVLDEAALIRALQEGHLAAAGLDVFDPEPPEPENPLLTMPNVIVTPHVASNTPQGVSRMSNSVVDQVLQLIHGERPTFLIDPAAWPGRMAGTANQGEGQPATGSAARLHP